MGNGWHEWPLVIFTVLGQCVAGGFIVMALGWMSTEDNAARTRILRSMFFLWVLMGLAFVASVLHLGSPLRAFNSLNRIGHSALSNEIASGSVFFAVGGFWWLLAILNKMPAGLGRIWAVITMILGVVFVWMMSRVYNSIDTVPTWYTHFTAISFFLTMIIGGPLLGVLLLTLARFPMASSKFAWLSLLGLVASAGLVILQSTKLATIQSSVMVASDLVPNFGLLQTLRLALVLLGLGCWLCPLLRNRPPQAGWLLLGFMMVAAGEMIGRGIFYGLHMTVGVAIAG